MAQVHRSDGGGDLVGVDGAHAQVEPGHGHGVGPDAAPEVVDGVHPGGAEPLGVLGSDLEAGRLLEAVGREEHALGEEPELRPGPAPQLRLVQGRGDELGVEAGVAEPLLEPELGAGLVRRQRLQEPPALARRQPAQEGQVHGRHCGTDAGDGPLWANVWHSG